MNLLRGGSSSLMVNGALQLELAHFMVTLRQRIFQLKVDLVGWMKNILKNLEKILKVGANY
jgi:hypothetical protein